MITNIKDVKTVDDLIDYVNAFALPTDTDSICHIQDVVGHTEIGRLEELAKEIPSKLYFILYHIWGWEDFTSFWNRVSNFEHNDYHNLRDKHNELISAHDTLQKKYDSEKEDNIRLRDLLNKKTEEYNIITVKTSKLESEVIQLKAKFYDYISKNQNL